MKSLKLLVVLLLLSVTALSQDVGASGGVVERDSQVLVVPSSTVIVVIDSNGQFTTGNLGTLSLVTPTLSSGNYENGGTFENGGAVSIQVPDSGIAFSGAVAAGSAWKLVMLANGNHYYVLEGTLTNHAGAFVLQTAKVGNGKFSNAAGVVSINVHLN